MFERGKQSYPEEVFRLFEEGAKRILRMTQELLDQHLLRKK